MLIMIDTAKIGDSKCKCAETILIKLTWITEILISVCPSHYVEVTMDENEESFNQCAFIDYEHFEKSDTIIKVLPNELKIKEH